MSLFTRKRESPQEIAAEAKLDEVTREVAFEELDKEGSRERDWWLFGPLTLAFPRFPKKALRWWVNDDPVPEPVDDPDPGDEHGLRDALHEGDPKQ